MKHKLLWIGKSSKQKSYDDLTQMYLDRLKHYARTEVINIKEQKPGKITVDQLKEQEAQAILSKVEPNDFLILLDERGKQFTSVGLSQYMQRLMNKSIPSVTFAIGGAYGVDTSVLQRADYIWSLSELTLTHDMARVLMIEQIYRAHTILRGEKYHNS